MGKLYVGNLSENTKGADLQKLFAPYGTVKWADIAVDAAGKSKGFGFVQMDDEMEARRAVAALNGRGFEGQMLKVSESTPQKKRPKGGGPRTRGSSAQGGPGGRGRGGPSRGGPRRGYGGGPGRGGPGRGDSRGPGPGRIQRS